jgi:hypothetical protein
MVAWLGAPLGAALVVLALLDMALAVLHIERESPVSSQLSRLTWRAMVWLSRPLSERRRGPVLSWGIPLLVGGTVAFWMTMFVAGFGLMYAPAIASPELFAAKDQAHTPGLFDAMYFSAVSFLTVGYGDLTPTHSAVSFLTVGYGDLTPTHPAMRILAVLEGACGLLTISLSVAYLVAIFPIITRKIVLAAALNQETAGRADGTRFVHRYLAAGQAGRLGERLARLNDELLYLGQAHSHYPLLFYVRPREVYESFVRVLAVVQGIVAMRYVLDPVEHGDLVADPGVDGLEEGLLYTLHGLERSLHFHVPEELRALPEPAVAERDFERLRALAERRRLTPVGPEHLRSALEGYVRFRQATDAYIRAYATSAAYDPDSVWAPYSRTRRDAGVEPAAQRLSEAEGADQPGARGSRAA